MTITSRIHRFVYRTSFALALPGMLLAVACDDPDQEAELARLGEDDLELAAEDAEAEEAAEGLADHDLAELTDRPDVAEGFVPLCCTITSPSIFNFDARLSTLSSEGCAVPGGIPAGAIISYTVQHYWGSPAPYTGYTTGPIANNSTKSVPLTHGGSLDALSCSAFAVW
ncbi:hypothetical protein [Nannocystis bainbridge]|uniref:Lipoprotein n=1 Tax=Nannocystis bainbridge TaxID=2995303 RepID=A0ABT5DUY2_9BACT|nr:hypothetical protein [Nannocystis bainbridge]MDC0717405.1 hypothetical protein [Nannocystis bainbridge]